MLVANRPTWTDLKATDIVRKKDRVACEMMFTHSIANTMRDGLDKYKNLDIPRLPVPCFIRMLTMLQTNRMQNAR